MVNTHPQLLGPNESDTYRILTVRYLAMLETYRPENSTNKVPIEEARQILIRLSDACRLTTDDRDLIDKTLRQLSKLGVPVIEKVNRCPEFGSSQ